MRRSLLLPVVLAAALLPAAARLRRVRAARSPRPSHGVRRRRAAVGPTPSHLGGRPARCRSRRAGGRSGTCKPSRAWSAGVAEAGGVRAHGDGPALRRCVIGLDPGHDIGNSLHLSQINATYWVGLHQDVQHHRDRDQRGLPRGDLHLRRRRAAAPAARRRRARTVIVTRDRNSTDTYGPCVGARGALGRAGARRLHGRGPRRRRAVDRPRVPRDRPGALPRLHRRHLRRVASAWPRRWSPGMAAAGLPPLDVPVEPAVRSARTSARSTCPTSRRITVETLNMRNAARRARLASSAAGRQKIAQALYAGIVRYARTR